MIKGKKAVITGGSRGIGAATAKKLASLGADIAVIYMGNEALANDLCASCTSDYGVKAESFRLDVSDYDAAKEAVAAIRQALGGIDILINNAGIARDKLLAMMKEADYDAVINTNLKGAFNMIRHCSGIFIRNRGGSIVNVSSVVGVHGNAGQANYAASKAGLIGLTKAVAKELAPKGVRCNAVAPGYINTDMTRDLPAGAEKWIQAIPLGHMGQAEDVADAICFLADSPYITGCVLPVDGGMGM